MDQSTSYRSDFFTGITEAVNSSTGSSRPSPAQLGVEGGSLHKLLRSREYNLFAQSAVFESDFIQVQRIRPESITGGEFMAKTYQNSTEEEPLSQM